MPPPLLTVLASCLAPIPTAPLAAVDGEEIRSSGAFRVVVVGGLSEAGPALDARLRAEAPDLLVLAGAAVGRSTPTDWAALQERVRGLPVVPLPGAGEARGDPRRERFLAAWDGMGVEGLEAPVPWRSWSVATGEVRWRLVVLDGDRDRLGDAWADQLHWLPKVVSSANERIVVLLDRPERSLGSPASDGATELMALLRRHADPARLVLVIAGTETPELILPSRWGEGTLGAGRALGAAPVPTRAGALWLDPVLARALSPDLEPDAAPPELLAPIGGWWSVELSPDGIVPTLWTAGAGAWSPTRASRWTPADGWIH